MTLRVLGVSGSLQKKSGNLELLRTAAASAPNDVEVLLFDGIRTLPLFDPDLLQRSLPEPVEVWCSALRSSHAVLIASPEYGHSLPGALKNAVDWVIGSGELYQKIVATTSAVAGPQRGLLGLAALRQTLEAVEVRIIGGEPIARGPDFEAEVAALVNELVQAVRASRV